MSVSSAIQTGDATELPGKRDEDWRWTDLRGLIRQIPAPSPEGHAWAWENPLADHFDMVVGVVNGRGVTDLEIAPGDKRFVGWRFLSTPEAGAHQAELWIEVGENAKLTLVESYEGRSSGYLANTTVNIKLAAGAEVERVRARLTPPRPVAPATAIEVVAPVDGVVLRRLHEGEGHVESSDPLLEIGDEHRVPAALWERLRAQFAA